MIYRLYLFYIWWSRRSSPNLPRRRPRLAACRGRVCAIVGPSPLRRSAGTGAPAVCFVLAPAVDSCLLRGVPEMPINDRPLSPSVPGRLPRAYRIEDADGFDILSGPDVPDRVSHLPLH